MHGDLVGMLRIVFLIALLRFVGAEASVVLVTGGAGYIGSHVCKALHKAGFTPVVYDSLVRGRREAVCWGPFVEGDLLDEARLEEAFSTYLPCAVFHLAGFCNVRESVVSPAEYYTNNVSGTIALLNAMKRHKVDQLVFSSSCTVYGNVGEGSACEESPKVPTNPYAKSKAFAEEMIQDYAKAYGLRYAILRFFNAAGVGEGCKRSEYSEKFLIPRAILSLRDSHAPLQIFGSHYATSDGTCVRDYIHVEDIAHAHLLALESLQRESDVYNLGSGKGFSVWEIVQMVEKVTGAKPHYQIVDAQAGDVDYAVAKVEKAKKKLGFVPQYSDLESIVQSEWRTMGGSQRGTEQNEARNYPTKPLQGL